MKNIPARLKNLLTILAGESAPVPVSELAKRLRVSRRTVFRELENMSGLLGGYNLQLGSRSGEGILLDGPEAGRTRLQGDLDSAPAAEPADRGERHQRLILELLRTPGQKLLGCADRFKVSAATISHDLDDIESWLAEYRITLVRKAGSSIGLEGTETDRRRAILGVMHQRRQEELPLLDYPESDIVLDVEGLREELEPLLGWMTPPSRDAIEMYLMVAVQRMMEGNAIESAPRSPTPGHDEQAAELCRILEECFNINPGQAEKTTLAVELAAARRNAETREKPAARDAKLAGMAYQLVERYDPEASHLLKLDDLLIDGLIAHLRSAVIRMENRIELPDPLLGQIRRSYPEVMEKSTRAAEILRDLGGWLPESEASFLAAHFGAAELRLAEQGLRRRVVRIGVVCVHGIGTSYLLASQVRKRFGGEAETDVGWWGDSEDWKRFDFLISTTELDAGDVPVVVVTPVLDDDGIEKIKKAVAKFSRREAKERTRSDSGFAELCRALEETAGDCASILSSFTVERAPADCDFEALAKLAGYRFADGEKRGRQVYEGLRDRENLSSQVIPELKLILLHCRTDGVLRPLVALIRPEGGRFTHPYFADSRAALVMLIPSSSSRARGELMGSVSAALIQTDDFLEAVRAGDAKGVERHLQGILRDHLGKFVNQHLKG